jgi:hypothetical protein
MDKFVQSMSQQLKPLQSKSPKPTSKPSVPSCSSQNLNSEVVATGPKVSSSQSTVSMPPAVDCVSLDSAVVMTCSSLDVSSDVFNQRQNYLLPSSDIKCYSQGQDGLLEEVELTSILTDKDKIIADLQKSVQYYKTLSEDKGVLTELSEIKTRLINLESAMQSKCPSDLQVACWLDQCPSDLEDLSDMSDWETSC